MIFQMASRLEKYLRIRRTIPRLPVQRMRRQRNAPGRIQKTQGPDLRPRQRPMGEMQRKYRIREKRCRHQPRHRVWRLHRR